MAEKIKMYVYLHTVDKKKVENFKTINTDITIDEIIWEERHVRLTIFWDIEKVNLYMPCSGIVKSPDKYRLCADYTAEELEE